MFFRIEPGVFLNASLIDEIRVEGTAPYGVEVVAIRGGEPDTCLGRFDTADQADRYVADTLDRFGLLG